MSYTSGEANNSYDLLEAINTQVVNVQGWELVYSRQHEYLSQDRLSHCLWCAKGDGNDKIYIQARIPDDGKGNRIFFDTLVGYDEKLFYFEQPGSIQQWLKSEGETEVAQPMFTTASEERFSYWLFVNDYRLIIVAKMSIVYESAYIGFVNPISSERQFPYPMYVAGNGVATGNAWPSNITGSFVFPTGNSGFLRRADGTWRAFNGAAQYPSWSTPGTIFPYNTGNKHLVPNYTSEDRETQNNLLLIPVMLQTNDPIDIAGVLREVYWVSGARDVSAEQILTYNDESYVLFDTKDTRGSNTYFAVKLV